MKRGFIGPLGDDFPAIFPIALGLMFFFASISVAYDSYYYKDTQSTLLRANVMISRSVRQQGVMTESYWRDFACPLITEIQANYGTHAALMITRPRYVNEATLSSVDVSERSLKEPFEFKNVKALCPVVRGTDEWVAESGMPTNPSRPMMILNYPVIVEVKWDGSSYSACEGVECERRPAVLAVYTWK
jgi:hypothetical protein